jgi:hypothetical protein
MYRCGGVIVFTGETGEGQYIRIGMRSTGFAVAAGWISQKALLISDVHFDIVSSHNESFGWVIRTRFGEN